MTVQRGGRMISVGLCSLTDFCDQSLSLSIIVIEGCYWKRITS